MFADSTPLRPFSATPEMIRNPNFVFPVKPQESPSGSPVESRFARRSSVPHALGPVPVIPAALESRPRSSGSAAQLLAGVGILPPPPVRPTNSGRNSPVGGAPPSPFSFGSGRPIPQRTSGLAPNPVTIGPVPSRLRNASGVEGNGSETVAPSVAAEEKSSSNTLAAPVNKPPMRRGHAHRRSGAVSSSDVWALMNNSAPALIPPKDSPPPVTTPPPNSQPSPIVSWSAPVSPGPGVATPQKSPMLGPIDSTPHDAAAAKRANRVSFIEHVEIIPRPLSAASSQATVKGHIGQESISSLASFNSLVQPTSTPNLSRTRSNSHSSVPRFPPLVIPDDENRPSTANALLNSPIDSPIEGLSRNNSLKRTVDAAITPTTPPPSKKAHKKAISDFALASFPKFSSDTTTKNTNANARISSEDDSAEGSSTPTNDEEKKKKKKKKSKGKGKSKRAKEDGGDKEDKEEGHSKKNKKKGWGLGKKVLGKHSKNRQLKALPRRSPTPPLPRSASGERIGGSEWVAAWNDSYVIVPPNWGEGSPSFMGQGESSPHSVESESPVIDLDAALGPFKTPQNIRGNFRAAKRYMHSSGRPAGSFGGPSFTGFHKRSESLPETRMELFALDENEGMEMGDVFEEEEEEEEDCSSSSSICSSAADSDYQNDNIGIGISIVDVDEDSDSSRRNSDASEEEVARSAQGSRRGSASSTKSARSLRSAQLKPRSSSHSMKIEEQPISPVIEEDEHLTISPAAKKSREHFRVSVISSSTQSSSSTVTPSSTLPVPEARPTTGNSPAASLMSLSTPYEESTRSNNHSEIYLAASETGSGFLAGEPSPDMRMSVDDVPSLTSCSSTMTGIAYREPATPGASESIKEGKSGKKSKKDRKEKRWSRVFGFLKIRS